MSNKNFYKVLVSSVSCWNDHSGSDTLPSLLEGYNPEFISTICYKTDLSTSDVSSRYFYICENDVIKSIFNKKIQTGYETFEKSVVTKQSIEKKRYSFWSKHRSWLILLMREFLWFLGKPKGPELIRYINDFKPQVLFCPFESYIYFNSINIWIAKKYNIPVIPILWDDNFTFKQNTFSLFSFIHRLILRKQIRTISKLSPVFFAISQKAQDELSKYLKRDVRLITKCASNELLLERSPIKLNHIKIIYSGKLNLGRDKTLIKFIEALKVINEEFNSHVILDIYAKSIDSKKLAKTISENNFVSYKGFVSQQEIKKIQKKYNLLVCLEALKGKNKNISRLSISTKFVDYLASGGCIFNISPKDTATYSYIVQNDIGFCAHDKKTIISCMKEIVENPNLIDKKIENSLKTCKEKHSMTLNQQKLYSAIEETVLRKTK